jgi:hypothetical protein
VASSRGDIILDQTFESDASFAAGYSLSPEAQTFTAGAAGLLKWIDASLVVPRAGSLVWEIRRTTNGAPSNEILASGSIAGYSQYFTNSYFEWVRFKLPESGIPVLSGDVLAFALRTSSSFNWAWYGAGNGDPYGEGSHFTLRLDGVVERHAGIDLGFRTYVQVDSLPPGYPRINALRRAQAELQFSVGGDSNQLCVVERSQDFRQWQPVLTNVLRTPSRTFLVTDTDSLQFYRARLIPRRHLFGLVVLNNIERNPGPLQLDSFDSSDPIFSTDGQYDPLKVKAGGDLGLFGNMNSTQRWVQICGKLWLSRDTTNCSLGGLGSVGDLAWHNEGKIGIQPGWLREDLDGLYPTPLPPTGTPVSPGSGIFNGEAYNYVLTDGFYKVANLSLNNSNKMLVTGRAVLWVTGDLSLAGTTMLKLQSREARLTLYADGFSSSLFGDPVGVYAPKNFLYYGSARNQSITIGCQRLVGVIYAPNADCVIVGGVQPREIIGSCVVRTLRLSRLSIHLDESLQDELLY